MDYSDISSSLPEYEIGSKRDRDRAEELTPPPGSEKVSKKAKAVIRKTTPIEVVRKIPKTVRKAANKLKLGEAKRLREVFEESLEETGILEDLEETTSFEDLKSNLKKAKSVKDSVVGQVALSTLRHVITENVAEFSGQKGADLLSEQLASTTESASFPIIATLLATTAAVYQSVAAGKLDTKDIIKKALIAATVAGACFFAAPGIASLAASYTSPIAAPIVETVINVFGGFIGSKLHGTEEVLIKPDEPMDSYFIKALQAYGAAQAFNMVVPVPAGLTATGARFVAGIATEGLAFNARMIGQVANKAIQHQLLSGVLITDEQVADMVSSYLTTAVQDNLFNPANPSAFIDLLYSAFPEAPQGDKSLASRVIAFLHKNLARGGLAQELTERMLSHGMQFTISSFNAYFHHLEQDEIVVDAKEQFDRAFRDFVANIGDVQSDHYQVELEKAFIHYKLAVDLCIKHAENEVPVARNAKSTLEHFGEKATGTRTRTTEIRDAINAETKKYIGLEIMQSQQTLYLSLLLTVHTQSLSRVLLRNILSLKSTPKVGEDDIKDFYSHATTLVTNTICCAMREELNDAIISTVQKQIKGASF